MLHTHLLLSTHTNVLQNETVNETDESADLCRFMFELCRLTELDTFFWVQVSHRWPLLC